MRTALSSLLLFSTLCAGCFAPHPYVVGTASYTAASPVSSASGALPLRAVACSVPGTHVARIHLGDHCILTGPLEIAPRGASVTGRLASAGVCALPGANGGVLSLQAATATYQNVGYVVDATVGGSTDDGRYVTYRFTGTFEEGPKDACEKLEGRKNLPPADGRTLVAPGREAWEGWSPAPPPS